VYAGVQIVGGLAIIAWTVTTAGLTFVAVNMSIGMRVTSEEEDVGLDISEHGAEHAHVPVKPYQMPMNQPTPTNFANADPLNPHAAMEMGQPTAQVVQMQMGYS